MPDEANTPSVDVDGPQRSRYALSGLQIVLLVLAVVLMGSGALLGALASDPEPRQPVQVDGDIESLPGVDLSLAPIDPNRQGESTPPADPSGLEAWSPMIFRMGFSFFVGFAIAYAVRSFIKLAVIAAGLFLLLLFGLQYANVVDVNWERMEEFYNAATAWLGDQTSSFGTFIRSFLPSTAMAGFGLVMGFRKK